MLSCFADKARLLAGFLVLLLIESCSTTDTPAPEWRSSLPSSVELATTPFFPQAQHQCGPAALATLLGYRHLDVDPELLVPRVYLPERKGSLQLELVATARSFGMLAYRLAPDLGDLLREVAAGNPVLVLQNLALDWLPKWHYAVVIGYDLMADELILRSGTTRRWRTSLANFNTTWRRGDNWALVILPPGELPATASLEPYLSAVSELEQTAGLKPAQLAYKAAARRWPDSGRVWLMLGNNAFALGDTGSAHTAFKRAISLVPDDPVAWNNLAYLYLQESCPVRARQAIERALRLKPGDANLVDSREEIERKAAQPGKDGCGIDL